MRRRSGPTPSSQVDFFEPPQNLDGYDVVETVAHQPWVLHNQVGMMGIGGGEELGDAAVSG